MKNKRLTIVIATALVGISTIIITTALISNTHHDFPDVDDGPGEEIFEKSLVFYNRDIVSAAYNRTVATSIADNIEEVVFSENEMPYSKNNTPVENGANIYYDAAFDIVSLTSIDSLTHTINFNMSDNRSYRLLIQTNTLEDNELTYIYSALIREGEKPSLQIVINGDRTNESSFKDLAEKTFDYNVSNTIYHELLK